MQIASSKFQHKMDYMIVRNVIIVNEELFLFRYSDPDFSSDLIV